MWYHSTLKKAGFSPKSSEFVTDVVDYIYGDDRLNAVYAKQQYLHGLSMKNYMEGLGLKITNSRKQEFFNEFESVEDVTFLKRSFRYHSQLGKIVCPLDLKTLKSGLSWVDKSKESDQVIRDKIHAFQREAFLHEEEYSSLIKQLEKGCIESGVNCEILSLSYLKELYNKNPQDFVNLSWGGSKYI